jgi:hypothetical protein
LGESQSSKQTMEIDKQSALISLPSS